MAGIMRAIQTVVLVIFPSGYSGFLTYTKVQVMQPLACYSILEADDIYYQTIIQLSYFTLLYIKLPVITFFNAKMTSCLALKMPYNPKNANTTNSQCFSIKARDRNDPKGHCLYLVVKSQYSPQGNDAPNVSYFLAWWWIRMSQTFRLKKFPKASHAWNTFHI